MHLGLGVQLQEFLVVGGVVLGAGVGVGAGAGRAGARRGQHRRLRVARVERACPARPLTDVVEVRRAVGVGLGPFAVEGRAPPRRRVVGRDHDARPARAGQVDLVLVSELELAHVEDLVLVRVHDQLVVDPLEHVVPARQAQEAVAEDELLFGDAVAADHRDGLLVPLQDRVRRDHQHLRLVDQAVDGDDVLVSLLGEEFRQLFVDVEASLGVERAVGSQDPPYLSLPTAVGPPVLTAGHGVEVEVHAQSVLSAVFDGAEEVAPADLGHVRVPVVGRDGPVRERDADVVQAGVLDVDEALLVDESGIVGFKDPRSRRAQLGRQRVLVHDVGRRGIVEHGRGDEGFQREPAADVDSPDGHFAILPFLVQGGNIVIGLFGVVPFRVETHDREASHRLLGVGAVEVGRVHPRRDVGICSLCTCRDRGGVAFVARTRSRSRPGTGR